MTATTMLTTKPRSEEHVRHQGFDNMCGDLQKAILAKDLKYLAGFFQSETAKHK